MDFLIEVFFFLSKGGFIRVALLLFFPELFSQRLFRANFRRHHFTQRNGLYFRIECF